MGAKEVAPIVVMALAFLSAFYIFWTGRNDSPDDTYMLQIVLNMVVFLVVIGFVLNFWLDVEFGDFGQVAWMAVYTGFFSYLASLLYTGVLHTTGTPSTVALHSTLMMQLTLFVVFFFVATLDKWLQQSPQMLLALL
jgi:uncharacterized membrane protein